MKLQAFGLPGIFTALTGAALATPTLLAQASIVDPNLSYFDKYGFPGICLLGLYWILRDQARRTEQQVDKLLTQLDATHREHIESLREQLRGEQQ